MPALRAAPRKFPEICLYNACARSAQRISKKFACTLTGDMYGPVVARPPRFATPPLARHTEIQYPPRHARQAWRVRPGGLRRRATVSSRLGACGTCDKCSAGSESSPLFDLTAMSMSYKALTDFTLRSREPPHHEPNRCSIDPLHAMHRLTRTRGGGRRVSIRWLSHTRAEAPLSRFVDLARARGAAPAAAQLAEVPNL